MSDLIKKIKIKKQDGTFTDYIPIGAEAQNVSTSDGESVQLKLNKKPYYYNNVAEMKADKKLKVGDMAITLGYYKVNDGGGATYVITSEKSETKIQIVINDSLYATLITDNKINVLQLGLKNDGEFDNITLWNDVYNFIHNNINIMKYKTILFPKGVYYFSDTVYLPELSIITGDDINVFNAENFPTCFKFTPKKDNKQNNFVCVMSHYQSLIENLCIDLTDSYSNEINRTNVGTPNPVFSETINVEAIAISTDGSNNTYKNLIIKNAWKGISLNAYNKIENIGLYSCKTGMQFSNDTIVSNVVAFNINNLFYVTGALNQINNIRADSVNQAVTNFGNQCVFTNFTIDWNVESLFIMSGCKHCYINNINYRGCVSIYDKDSSLENFSDNSYIDQSMVLIQELNNADFNYYNVNFPNKINIRDQGEPLYIYPTLYVVTSTSENETSHSSLIFNTDIDLTNKSNIKRICYPIRCKNFNAIINGIPYKITNLNYQASTNTTVAQCNYS